MSDIDLACHANAWSPAGLISAMSEIEAAGFKGLEVTAEVVEQYEDRVGVFTEILAQHHLGLTAISAGGAMWPGMNLDEEVERNLNIARFLKACDAKVLTLYPPRPNPDQPLEDELDILPAATAYGEIARRTQEVGVLTCLHPEIGTCVDSVKTLNKFLQMADPEALKICVDNGFLAEAGIPCAGFIKEFRKRLGLVHLRDLKPKEIRPPRKTHGKKHKEPARPHSIELGKGSLELEKFVDDLLAAEYQGWATIEFEALPDRTLAEMAKASHRYAEQHLDLVL